MNENLYWLIDNFHNTQLLVSLQYYPCFARPQSLHHKENTLSSAFENSGSFTGINGVPVILSTVILGE